MCVGARVEGTAPSLGKQDEGKTNLKLSKSKLCSKRRRLILFFAPHYLMSGVGKLFLEVTLAHTVLVLPLVNSVEISSGYVISSGFLVG